MMSITAEEAIELEKTTVRATLSEQGQRARAHLITASYFHRVVKRKTGFNGQFVDSVMSVDVSQEILFSPSVIWHSK